MGKSAVGFVYDSLGLKELSDEQKRQISQYCSEAGLKLKHIYSCSKKDLKDRQKYFNSIIEENASEVDTFVIHSVTRISRKFDEFKEIIENFRKHGIEVVSLNESENMWLDNKNPMHELAMKVASGEINMAGGYDEEKFEECEDDEPEYEEKYKTNLPYGYEFKNGKIVVDESKKEVVAWIFNAAERYSNDVPDILVKKVQRDCLDSFGAHLDDEEAKGRVSYRMIEEYLCMELNIRLKKFNPDDRENSLEKIRECLSMPLNEEQKRLLEDRAIRDGSQYRMGIIRHILTDSDKASRAERIQKGLLHHKTMASEQTQGGDKPKRKGR